MKTTLWRMTSSVYDMKKSTLARSGALILIAMLFGWIGWIYRHHEQITIRIPAEDLQSWIDDMRDLPGVRIIQEQRSENQ